MNLPSSPCECWFCGCCASHCPAPEAIRMEHALARRAGWERKEAGQRLRIGMKDPLPVSTRPPLGGWGKGGS